MWGVLVPPDLKANGNTVSDSQLVVLANCETVASSPLRGSFCMHFRISTAVSPSFSHSNGVSILEKRRTKLQFVSVLWVHGN